MLPHNNMNTEPLNPPGPAGHRNTPAAGTGAGPNEAVGGASPNKAVGAIGSDWGLAENISAADLVGTDVVSYHNKIIGEVEGTTVVAGDRVYLVSVDQELGMGSRLISIHQDHVSVFRNHANVNVYRIAVDVTQEQIRNQPAYTRGGSVQNNLENPGQTR